MIISSMTEIIINIIIFIDVLIIIINHSEFLDIAVIFLFEKKHMKAHFYQKYF